MLSRPKYKTARRVGAPIFEKTQTAKYKLREERKSKSRGFSRPKSEYGIQQNEKQKARFTYGTTEKQLANYVKEALARKTTNPVQTIFEYLEFRLDNAVYRAGLASTRRAGRQMVSHGHILVNGRRTTPSRRLRVGDSITIREGSKDSGLWKTANDRSMPQWLRKNGNAFEVIGKPEHSPVDTLFDLNAVIEFYSR